MWQNTEEELLLAAARQGDAVQLKRIVLRGPVNINAGRKNPNDRCTALMLVAKKGDVDLVSFLIENGADVNRYMDGGVTALMLAARDGNFAVVQRLITAGAAPCACTDDGWTALHFAARYGDLHRVSALIRAGAFIDGQTLDGVTALMLAVSALQDHLPAGHIPKVVFLFAAGASVESRDRDQMTPLMYLPKQIMQQNNVTKKILDFLLAPLDSQPVSGISEDVLRTFIPNGCDTFGWTSLMYAAKFGTERQISRLLRLGANVNRKTSSGLTALMLSARDGDVDGLKRLIQGGADVNARMDDDWTALHFAARYGDSDRVDVLIKNGADINAPTKVDKVTPLMVAAKGTDVRLLNHLLAAGAIAQAEDSDNWTALMFARKWGTPAMVDALNRAMMESTNLAYFQKGKAPMASLYTKDVSHQVVDNEGACLDEAIIASAPEMDEEDKLSSKLDNFKMEEKVQHASDDATLDAESPSRTNFPVCCICLEAEAWYLMSGCGHLCLCEKDSRKVSNACPMCRVKGTPKRVYA